MVRALPRRGAVADQLAQDKRIRLVGINYKDQPDNARRFLGRYGNPFAAVGADPNGRAAIEWGVYGVPETFVVGRDGRIAYKLVGPITRGESVETRAEAGDREGAGANKAARQLFRFRAVFLQQRKLQRAEDEGQRQRRRTP